MNRRLRHDRPSRRRCLDALGILAAVVLLVCLELSLRGDPLQHVTATAGTSPLEAMGSSGSDPHPIALTGARGFAIIVGAGDGRHRSGQLVEPGTAPLTTGYAGAHDGETVASGRPPHLVLRGLLAVRAPPAPFAFA